MAFQMIHMEIAYRLLKRILPISNPAEFILGSVALDSVHMNSDYDVNMKVKSHMFEGCGRWSDTQDYQLWDCSFRLAAYHRKYCLRNGKYISQQKAVNRDNEPHAGRIAEPGGHRPRPDI